MVIRKFFSKIINENGQDLVEYAFTFMWFAFIMFMIFDLGRLVYYYSAMQNAAREGARYGVVNPRNISQIPTNQIIAMVKARSLGLDQNDISVSVSWSCEIVNVHVDFYFKPVTPAVGRLFPPNGDVNISTGSELQRERFDLAGEDAICYTTP